MYFKRILSPPNKNFFLFGPRGTGKTHWLNEHFNQNGLYLDLLKSSQFIEAKNNPEFLSKKIASGKFEWVIIDEIQKVPSLLDEVHSIMNRNQKIKFALTGSSARKLKKAEANLLGGRAQNRLFFPLTSQELNYSVKVEEILKWGLLPQVINEKSNEDKYEFLFSYYESYLKEEIQQEALVRNLDSFMRFLNIASNMNGQILSISNIAKDCGVARTTVEGYYSILVDTLIGFKVPAWTPKFKVKEILHPKFYFFDTGIVRTLRGSVKNDFEQYEEGYLFETLVLHELRAYNSYSRTNGLIYYWGTPTSEVDFIWIRGKEKIGIEVKSAKKWKSEYGKTLKELKKNNIVDTIIGVYLGDEEYFEGDLRIMSYLSFCKYLV